MLRQSMLVARGILGSSSFSSSIRRSIDGALIASIRRSHPYSLSSPYFTPHHLFSSTTPPPSSSSSSAPPPSLPPNTPNNSPSSSSSASSTPPAVSEKRPSFISYRPSEPLPPALPSNENNQATSEAINMAIVYIVTSVLAFIGILYYKEYYQTVRDDYPGVLLAKQKLLESPMWKQFIDADRSSNADITLGPSLAGEFTGRFHDIAFSAFTAAGSRIDIHCFLRPEGTTAVGPPVSRSGGTKAVPSSNVADWNIRTILVYHHPSEQFYEYDGSNNSWYLTAPPSLFQPGFSYDKQESPILLYSIESIFSPSSGVKPPQAVAEVHNLVERIGRAYDREKKSIINGTSDAGKLGSIVLSLVFPIIAAGVYFYQGNKMFVFREVAKVTEKNMLLANIMGAPIKVSRSFHGSYDEKNANFQVDVSGRLKKGILYVTAHNEKPLPDQGTKIKNFFHQMIYGHKYRAWKVTNAFMAINGEKNAVSLQYMIDNVGKQSTVSILDQQAQNNQKSKFK